MLSQADRNLIERDTALSGLGLLLDADAFGMALGRVLPAAAGARARISYLRYKPGANCLAKFELDLDGQVVGGYAKTYSPDAAAKLRKAYQRTTLPSPLGPGRLLLAEDAVEVAFFPNDTKLPSLRKLADDGDRRSLLKRLLRKQPHLWEGSLEQLHYKPERRFVARVVVDGAPMALVKLYTERDFVRARRAARAFDPDATLQIPPMLGSSERRRGLAFEWLEGQPLQHLLVDPLANRDAIRAAGAALAEFHRLATTGLARQSASDVRASFQAAADAVAWTCPPLTRLVASIVDRLNQLTASSAPEQTPIHGDFYPNQVLIDGDRAVIIDLDNAAIGEPAADIGLFIAHLERNALTPGRPKAPVDSVRNLLIEGYGSVRPVPADARVDLQTAIGLLQLAPHHFRNREPDWLARTEATLTQAAHLIERSARSGSLHLVSGRAR